jgi:hypothetical protein
MSIRQIANDVWKKLGPGYSESVYHAAFEVGRREQQLPVCRCAHEHVIQDGQRGPGGDHTDAAVKRRLEGGLKDGNRNVGLRRGGQLSSL